MKQLDTRLIAGWIAVVLSTAVASFWAFWGIIENFHEGWFYESLLSNVGVMFAQYLSPMLIFITITLVSIYWPRLGGSLYGIFALLVAVFFQAFTNTVVFFIILPLIALGVLFWFGRPRPRQRAAYLATGIPVIVLIISGIEPAFRVNQRLDDGNLGARLVQGDQVSLVWAPDGPGWPRTGTDWNEASQECQHLNEDGITLASEPMDIWRLPTVDEAVRSITRQGQNSGGTWDENNRRASYSRRPDKESPLWNVHSQVIYWWTASEADEGHAYMIAYNGEVWPRAKNLTQDYLGFRCVQ